MLQNATTYFAEFARSVKPLKCFSIYAYLLSIGKTNSSATCQYLMVPLSNYGNGKTNSSATSFNMKNRSTQKKKSCSKKGSRAKKLHCKKTAANLQQKTCHVCMGPLK